MIEQIVKYILQFAKSLLFGSPALNHAAEAGNTFKVKKLLREGTYVDSRPVLNKYILNSETPLIRAARNGHAEVVQLLLAYHADINALDHRGNTAVMIAMINMKPEVAGLLLSHETPTNTNQEYDPRILLLAAENEYLTLIKLLVGQNVDLNKSGRIMTKEGIDAEHQSIDDFLDVWGCDFDYHSDCNCIFKEENAMETISVLGIAARRNNIEIAQLLVESGASVLSQFNICSEYTEKNDEEISISQYLSPRGIESHSRYLSGKYIDNAVSKYLLNQARLEMERVIDTATRMELYIEVPRDVNKLIVSFNIFSKKSEGSSKRVLIENECKASFIRANHYP